MNETAAPAIQSYGRAIRHEWPLDPEWLTVNHGSFGAAPKVVLAEQQRWRDAMEAQPSRFMRHVLPDALRASAAALGAFVGADGKDVAFLDNATTGCNAVLRSLRLNPGDEIVVLSHGYGAVRNTVTFVTERAQAKLVEATLPFPHAEADEIVAHLVASFTSRTRLAVIDHITSPTAMVLPLERMVAACHDAGIPVLVDGAHAPGQVDVDVTALGADWYVGNCHKWLMAPKGCAFIWARPDRQDDLHPVTISHGYGGGFIEEFDWTGTRDATAFLAIDAAIAFHHRLGGAALRARNAKLAAEGTALVAERLRTSFVHAPTGSMGVIRMPIAGPATRNHAKELRERLFAANTDAPLMAQDGEIWLRISAQAYNELADYEKLSDIVLRAFLGNS